MKNYSHSKLFLVTITILINTIVLGQKQDDNNKIYFKNGIAEFEENVSTIQDNSIIKEIEVFQDKFYRYIQFYDIPSQEQRRLIEQKGIKLLEYIPKNVYIASIPIAFDLKELKSFNVRSLIEISDNDKLDSPLLSRPFPDHVNNGDKIRVLVHRYSDIAVKDFSTSISLMGITLIEVIAQTNVVVVEMLPSQFAELSSKSFVRYMAFEARPGEPESDDGRNLHRANAIDVDYFGGYDFDGTGVSVAINDDGFAGPHIDFKGRADQSNVINDFTGGHGDMTVGIVGAAGNLDPTMRGMAPGAFLWVRSISGAFANTLSLHQNEDVMVFSTSYSDGCNAGYTSLTQQVDEEIYDNPSLIQVFSTGNNNNNDCGYGAGDQWGNITGGHKMGKNVMATANLDNLDSLSNSSSHGPASDGRIKPDIAAHGAGHYSTSANNNYSPGGGTSAAAPGIAGVLTQLHQAYREFNNGDNAPSGLLKASILNTANDLGNPGPDFKFGWGKVNAYKAMKTLEDERYISDSISHGDVEAHILSVPANVEEMRVMVYWHDLEGSISASYALVNNLDMRITDPLSNIYQPLVLDHTPNPVTLNNNAIPGNDSINNVEQIRIANPSNGNYTITITGTAIPQGPQTYFVVYEYIYNEIMVTYPVGGEGLIPGSTERIHWDAIGSFGNFTAEYTTNGTTWTIISDTIPGDARFVDFPVPNIVSRASVRISRNSIYDESDEYFSIIDTPSNIVINSVCSGTNTIQVSWDSVTSATSYDVFLLGAMYMDSVATTNDLNYSIVVPNVYQDNWISVRARGSNWIVGRRAIAIKADGSDCYLDCISEDDAGVESILSPTSFNESCSGNLIDVVVNLTNIGPNVQTGFPVYYQLNNNTVVIDTFTNTLSGGSIETFTFTDPLYITTSGSYTITVWTGLDNDGALCNDTLEYTFQFFNPITAFPYIEDFQSNVFPPGTISIENPDGDMTWEEADVVGSNGSQTKTAYVNNLVYNNQGGEDYMSIVSFDLSNTSYAVLKFDVAYTPYSSYYSDGLRIDLSTDCGLTYSQVYLKEGDSLSTTAGPTTSVWEPDSISDWRRDTIDLSAYTGGIAKIRFVNINGWGNNLYVDNIELVNTNQASYCIPTSNCTVGDEIDDFFFNTISQTGTGCGTDGYSNFLTYNTTLEAGVSYTMSLNTNYSNQYVSMWIDFNNDTIFDNITERVMFDFNLPTTGTLYDTLVTIPSSASLGSHRMRVRAHWQGSCEDPCVHYSYGEAHDYMVTIVPNSPLAVSLGPDVSTCEGSSYDIYANVTGGISPYNYTWSSGETTEMIAVNPISPSGYSVIVIDSYGNTVNDSILITLDSLPTVYLGPDQTIILGSSVTLDAGSGFTSYMWSNGETTQTIDVSLEDVYSVTITDGNSCSNSDDLEVFVIISNGPGWNVIITGSNHSILIPDFANLTVDGNPLDIGDYIGVFYDSLGTMVCGGFMIWTGATGSISAWGEDVGNDGFIAGEEFLWRIWKYTTELEYYAVATYMQPPLMPHTSLFSPNGLSGIVALEYTTPSPGWTFQITGSNHIILIPDNTSIQIEGVQVSTGDYLGVFYDSLGTLVCAGYEEYNGNTLAVTAWGEDIGNDGFTTNEEFSWMVWDASEDTIYSMYAEYSLGFPNQEYYATNGISGIASLTSVSQVETQEVILSQGWGIYSTYIIPQVPSIDSVFSDVVQFTIICKNANGNVYWPLYNLNQIGSLVLEEGYLIKMELQQTLIVTGIPVIPETNGILLEVGWDMIAYLRKTPAPIIDILSSIVSSVIIVKDGDGNTYWPQYTVNLIGNMQAGKGYQIKMSTSESLTYPPN
jgi:hypothetical protein